jgi:hypothetical protein
MLRTINPDVAAGLSGFLEWSQPVIFDRLAEIYQIRLGRRGPVAQNLATLHAGAWRALIAGDISKFAALRGDLARALQDAGLDANALLDQSDGEILTELLEIVMARYQRAMYTARGYHLALIALAGRLAPPPQGKALRAARA